MPAARRRAIANPLAEDLDHVLAHTEGLWEDLRGRRLFLTGGSGFFGCWLLESLLWANDRLDLRVSATVLTRNPVAFRAKAPHLADHPCVELQVGDVTEFAFPTGTYSHVLHAATEASAQLIRDAPLQMWRTIVAGTERTLEFAMHCGASRYLLTSSGAVYGKQPPTLTHLPEDYPGAPDPLDPRSCYGEGKRAAEQLCAVYTAQHGIATTIARGFAFLGPYLPMDRHFAVGNFLRDGLQGGPVRVSGDGTPVRSYLYAADLAVWLWTILLRGQSGRAYNVGSEQALSIADLARTVAAAFTPAPGMTISRPSSAPSAERYVPCTARARDELGLSQSVDLPDGLARTLRWLRATRAPGRIANPSG
jgi:nucleoside-diphosphate-sugar epimerase